MNILKGKKRMMKRFTASAMLPVLLCLSACGQKAPDASAMETETVSVADADIPHMDAFELKADMGTEAEAAANASLPEISRDDIQENSLDILLSGKTSLLDEIKAKEAERNKANTDAPESNKPDTDEPETDEDALDYEGILEEYSVGGLSALIPVDFSGTEDEVGFRAYNSGNTAAIFLSNRGDAQDWTPDVVTQEVLGSIAISGGSAECLYFANDIRINKNTTLIFGEYTATNQNGVSFVTDIFCFFHGTNIMQLMEAMYAVDAGSSLEEYIDVVLQSVTMDGVCASSLDENISHHSKSSGSSNGTGGNKSKGGSQSGSQGTGLSLNTDYFSFSFPADWTANDIQCESNTTKDNAVFFIVNDKRNEAYGTYPLLFEIALVPANYNYQNFPSYDYLGVMHGSKLDGYHLLVLHPTDAPFAPGSAAEKSHSAMLKQVPSILDTLTMNSGYTLSTT